MDIFANYDEETNDLKGFYTTDVHNENNIPKPNIKITKEDWKNALDKKGEYKIDIENEKLMHNPKTYSLKERKNQANENIREKSGELIDNRFKPFDRENLFVLENSRELNINL